jgi:hypothetical protein
MIRKQVYIEAHHERLLKERAKRYRVTEAELLRRALDQGLAPTTRPPGIPPDPAAWREIEAFLARRRRKRAPRRARTWRREDLYDR